MKITVRKTSVVFALAGIVLLLAMLFTAGCAKRLSGEKAENEKPIVWFVNIPSENYQSSVNPIIHWVGQDRDGQIAYFRYIVVTEDVIGAALGKPSDWNPINEPLTEAEHQSFVSSVLLPGTDTTLHWITLEVADDTESTNPMTSNIVTMQADISSPILIPVPQVVFLQAFDEDGLGSDVVFRRFHRVDNPPETRMIGFIEGIPFINAVVPNPTGQGNTGVSLWWRGSDLVDYPSDPPPFEFEWKLYGPYQDSVFDALIDSFVINVFVTNDAQVFRFGEPPDTIVDVWVDSLGNTHYDTTLFPTAYITCDTTFESGSELVVCDTIFIDTITVSNVFGRLDVLLRAGDADFEQSAIFNKWADASGNKDGLTPEGMVLSSNPWALDTQEILYNVYNLAPDTVTREENFIFWVRSRDDARVPDLTPTFVTFAVIDPQFERDVFVVDLGRPASINRGHADTSRAYWQKVINDWGATRPENIVFDSAVDFVRGSAFQNDPSFLTMLLSHKEMILVNDDVHTGILASQGSAMVGRIYTALESGVNAWLVARVPVGPEGGGINEGDFGPISYPTPFSYRFYFGAEELTYTGWTYYCLLPFITGEDAIRVEDFIGTYSLDAQRWPDLSVDTALLHSRYRWTNGFPYSWESELLAYPEVNWAVRTAETEAMYLYKSLYGAAHFMGGEFSFDGHPVAHRLNRGIFRSIHFLFSPMAMEQTSALVTTYGNLSWLYDGWLSNHPEAGGGVAKRTLDPAAAETAARLGEHYWRCYRMASDADEFYRLLADW